MARTIVHYHVFAHMAGCLPEGDPYTCTTKQDAMYAAREEAEGHREAGYRVRGNKQTGYEYGWPTNECDEAGYAHSPVSIGGYFGVIYWEACSDPGCELLAESERRLFDNDDGGESSDSPTEPEPSDHIAAYVRFIR